MTDRSPRGATSSAPAVVSRARTAARARFFPGIALIGLGCASSTPPPEAPSPDIAASARRSVAADREKVALTVYNSNFALVREERRLSLGTGRVALAYEDVSAHVQPATVHLRSLDAADGLSVLEQNYRYDLLSPETLLQKYVGQRLKRSEERRVG